jgi:uncharacterized membrane protein YphA (DoxX/SURF4 family)
MKICKIQISWAAQIIAAIILAQTLFFKFTGAEESVALFTKLGAEPFGRYASGTMELIAVFMLLSRRLAWLGAILGMGVMAGAILSHLTVLGIETNGDGGLLFGLAIVTFVCCVIVGYIRKSDLLAKFHLSELL